MSNKQDWVTVALERCETTPRSIYEGSAEGSVMAPRVVDAYHEMLADLIRALGVIAAADALADAASDLVTCKIDDDDQVLAAVVKDALAAYHAARD